MGVFNPAQGDALAPRTECYWPYRRQFGSHQKGLVSDNDRCRRKGALKRSFERTKPAQKETDFVFPSLRAEGKVPLYASTFVGDHLRPAAITAGVRIETGQRFGLHNIRHSLSNWLVNKAKVEPKTVQGILRHSKIQTTLDL